jgi:hypothetical protein
MIGNEEVRVEELARKIAANGASYLKHHQRALERARVILARSEQDKIETLGSPLYPWELGGPSHLAQARRRIFTASADLTSTGLGMTVRFMAGLAHGEVEFRRRFAGWVGPHVANGAVIRIGTENLAPFNQTFVSPALKAVLDDADRGGPAAFSYLAEFGANYS